MTFQKLSNSPTVRRTESSEHYCTTTPIILFSVTSTSYVLVLLLLYTSIFYVVTWKLETVVRLLFLTPKRYIINRSTIYYSGEPVRKTSSSTASGTLLVKLMDLIQRFCKVLCISLNRDSSSFFFSACLLLFLFFSWFRRFDLSTLIMIRGYLIN